MSINIASLLFYYIIIPCGISIIITISIIQIYNRLKYKNIANHNLELKILELENQIKVQKEKANLLSEEISIILSRTNQTNSKLDRINSLLEIMDDNILSKNISRYQVISPGQTHVNNPDIKQSQTEPIDDDRHNSTIEYILKKLENNSLTTREIQRYIGRTREHTSRLMKKLYDNKFVDRDMDSKPFKYTITDEGRKLLIKHSDSKNNLHSDYQRSKANLTNWPAEIQSPENLK
ncbi:MAG: helix-turn-helix transcriptional regulator [Nitrosopumilus sp.]|nr:helix-turn-helix transcriptional regulator [Nitrosopumilus sp.]